MYPVIDLHCDTLSCGVVASGGALRLRENDYHVDLAKLKAGGALAQCFAAYIAAVADTDANPKGLGPYEYYHECVKWFRQELTDNPELAQARCAADILKNQAEGRISAIFTVEDSVPLEGRMERLSEMYTDGVRMMSLTWNYENSVGYPNARLTATPDGGIALKNRMGNLQELLVACERGLKPFGIEVVRRMNELGMIVDVSHLSDGGFYDVAKYSKKPFAASHSNARSVCGVFRNLTDEMLKILGDTGSVTGLNFCADFLREGAGRTYCEDVISHALHIKNKAGIEALALGSDFDGIENGLEFTDYSGYQQLFCAMEKHFTPRELELITHKNALRLIKECCGG